MTVAITTAANNGRLSGLIAFADTGAANARIRYYSTTQPALGGAPGGAAIVEITLTKPCGAVVDNKLVLTQLNAEGDLIALDAAAVWGRMVNGNGDTVLDGDVSDETGDGFFKVGGTDGTMLRAGGRFILDGTEIT
jgi:hypothetical protein